MKSVRAEADDQCSAHARASSVPIDRQGSLRAVCFASPHRTRTHTVDKHSNSALNDVSLNCSTLGPKSINKTDSNALSFI